MSDTFAALGDPTRREILRLLRQRDMSAGELSEHFALARSTLSGHFNVLKHAGLIVAERRGTTIVYSLNVSVVEETVAALLELFDTAKQRKGAKACKPIVAWKSSS
ncbi:MAG: autorepressor SdpR family transcription factor [Pirellulales bacterium]